MKIRGEKYDTMYRAMRDVVNHYRIKSADYALMWQIWSQAWYDLQYNDDHPAFQQGRKRIVAHHPGFDVYSDGCHDAHITSALRRICRELGLE